MTAVSKDLLLKSRLPEVTVEIEGVGEIRVRGLSRAEAMQANKAQEAGGVDALYRYLLLTGVVEPALTEAEVDVWMDAATAAELEPIAVKVAELSGMMPDAEKQAVRTFREEPGAGVRVLPGAEAGDDGGPAAGRSE